MSGGDELLAMFGFLVNEATRQGVDIGLDLEPSYETSNIPLNAEFEIVEDKNLLENKSGQK